MTDGEDKKEQDKNNFDWNKKGFETSERLTLKINVHEASQYQAEKGKEKIGNLPKNLKNLRKKVRDSYDEEDDGEMDEDVLRSLQELQMNLTDASNGDTSLLNALLPSERRLLNQKTTIEISRQEDNAGKMTALMQADALSRRAGIGRLNASDYANQMQEALYNPRRLRNRSLEKNIADKIGVQGKIKKQNVKSVADGVKQIKETSENRKVKNLNMDDVAKVGKQKLSQNATAELILKKSGQTARLSEIKRGNVYRETDTQVKTKTYSYSEKMKELLKETLRKNDKVH